MSYQEWFKERGNAHNQLYKKLEHLSKEKTIEYFRWENMVKEEKDFCPLFAKNQKCHDTKDLNCFFCGCPNFRFNDEGKEVKSFCAIESKDGKTFQIEGVVHQDCSNCLVPHRESYIVNP